MTKAPLRIFALGGVTGPVLFTLITLVCASLRPNYNHLHHFISELGATGTDNASLMNFAGFIPSGIMIAMFGLSLTSLLPKSFPARAGSFLLILFGTGMTVVGFFSCDPGCPRDGTVENNIHDQISGPIFLSAIIGILALGIAFKNLTTYRSLWMYTVVSSLLSLCFIIALINSLETYTFTGLWQRLLLLTLFLWLGIVGLHTFKLKHNN